MFEAQRDRLKVLAKSGKQVFTSGQRLLENQRALTKAIQKLTPVEQALNRDLDRWQKRTAPHLAKVQKIVEKLQK